jgi:hypothetical protein
MNKIAIISLVRPSKENEPNSSADDEKEIRLAIEPVLPYPWRIERIKIV